MHIDLGPAREWGRRFPFRDCLHRQSRRAHEPLAESRTMKGGGAAGVATSERRTSRWRRRPLTETQTAILPLVPYLDTLRWMFIAVALAASPSRSTPGSMTGAGGADDCKHCRWV
jgi:zinc D-Ala-D-Ala carboxypeptidase